MMLEEANIAVPPSVYCDWSNQKSQKCGYASDSATILHLPALKHKPL